MGIQVFDTIGQNLTNFSANQGLKKSLEEKLSEKAKMYNFIGMETYDLYKSGKIVQPELDIYFEKMKTLEQEIAEIQAKTDKPKTEGNGSIKCSCGAVLPAESRFCPNCGIAVQNDWITCSCGRQIKRDMTFCSYCGQKISEISGSADHQESIEISNREDSPRRGDGQVQGRECICGAIVPAGQSICMECGRRIAD